MKLMRYLLPLLVALGFTSSAVSAPTGHHKKDNDSVDEARFNEELNERDWDALQDYINTKRTINVAEKADNLTISGDVRLEWRHIQERRLGRNVRGRNHVNPDRHRMPKNLFDIEANLFVEYTCKAGWAITQLQFDNPGGIDGFDNKCEKGGWQSLHGSGFSDSINLKRAYMGYNFFADEGRRFDIELGRRPLYTIFDSEVQFLNRFDGILLKWDDNCTAFGDWYIHAGSFIVDQKVNHFAFVGEVGFLNVCESLVDFKFSFIDWQKHWVDNNGKSRCGINNPRGSRYAVSQFTLHYHLDPKRFCVPAEFYGALLWNVAAGRKSIFSKDIFDDIKNRLGDCAGNDNHAFKDSGSGNGSSCSGSGSRRCHSRRNFAWYLGFTLGEVVDPCDWSLDIQYQYVEARAIPDEDVSGIGTGNALKESLFIHGRGNTNYKGWRLELLYLLAENLSIDARAQWSTQISKKLWLNDVDLQRRKCGQHGFSEYRIQMIYAF